MKDKANTAALFFALTVLGAIIFVVVAPSASGLRAGWIALTTTACAFAFMRSALRYLRHTTD